MLEAESLLINPNPKVFVCTSGPCNILQNTLAEEELTGIRLRELVQFPVNLQQWAHPNIFNTIILYRTASTYMTDSGLSTLAVRYPET